MWLSRKLKDDGRTAASPAERGAVTVGGSSAGVWSRGEERNIPSAAPGGYVWRPRSGENVLVLKGGEFGEERYIVGALEDAAAEELAEGEICLHSAGGARLYLRNDGRVELVGELYINGERYVPPTEGL